MCHLVLVLESILRQVCQPSSQEFALGVISHAQVQQGLAPTAVPTHGRESFHRYPTVSTRSS
jgi:hypothetical protein